MAERKEFLEPPSSDGWFILSQEKYLGPFSAEELKEFALKGHISRNSQIWNSSFSEWRSLPDVPELALVYEFAPSEVIVETVNAQQVDGAEYRHLEKNLNHVNSPGVTETIVDGLKNWPTLEFQDFKELEANRLEAQRSSVVPDLVVNLFAFWNPLGARTKVLLILLGVIIVGTVIFVTGTQRFDTSKLGISKQELIQMKAVAETPLSEGPLAVLSLSNQNTKQPYFLIATNLPDDSEVLVQVEGVLGTLVGSFFVSEEAVVAVSKGLAKSPVFQDRIGHPFPKGEYVVSVSCYSCSEEKKLYSKPFFLGGIRDTKYDQELSYYNAKIREQAQAERDELRQLLDVSENSLTETVAKFESLVSNQQGSLLKEWESFSSGWLQIQEQVQTLVVPWSEADLKSKKFYSECYRLMKEIIVGTSRLHRRQSEWMQGSSPKSAQSQALLVELAQSANLLRSLVTQERGLLLTAEKLPVSSSGMPKRP